MNKTAFLPVLMLLALNVLGQTAPADSAHAPKLYRGEESLPRAFEPFNAHYKIVSELGGLDLFALQTSTAIVETDDGLRETFAVFLPVQNERLQVLRIVSDIDAGSGLLRKIEYKYAENSEEYILSDGKITLNQTKNGKIKQFVFDHAEKFYPCSYAASFYAYLPLAENFSGSFNCFLPQTDGKPTLLFRKLTLTVVKTEIVATENGDYNCFVVESRSEKVADANAEKSGQKSQKIAEMSAKDLRQANFARIWIDKKSHKLIKSELESKIGAFSMEMER